MKILEKNLKALEKNMPELSIKLKEYININGEQDSDEFLDLSMDERIIAGYKKRSRLWYFNSRYYPYEAAKKWAEQFKELQYDYTFFVFGFGNGMYIQTINEMKEKTFKLLIYEPCTVLFYKVLKTIDVSDILENENNKFIIKEINDEILQIYIGAMIGYDNVQLFNYVFTPNYNRVFYDEFKEMFFKIFTQKDRIFMDRNTKILYAGEFQKNIFENLNDMITGCEVGQLKGIIPNDIPSIIVSAGPSLNKNICELRQAKGKAFIIAVDTALKPLLKAGITPDIFVTVDPHKPLELFNDERIKNIPAVICGVSHYKIFKNHKAKKFFFQHGNAFLADLYRHQGVELHLLPTGGSVANNAFSLAVLLGFKTIILVGQDLAFTNDKAMADGAYDNKNKTELSENPVKYVEVEDIHGNSVKTLVNLKHYLIWFENMIKFYTDIHVIDATEGGAKIHGSEIMPLRRAIDEYCGTYPIDLQADIDSIQPVFTVLQQKEIKEELIKLPVQIDDVKKMAEVMMKDYKKLYTYFKNDKYNSKDFAKLFKRIKKNNQKMETNSILELVLLYMQKEDYIVRGKIMLYKDDIKNDGINIANQGIIMTESLQRACEEMKQDFISITGKFNWENQEYDKGENAC